MRVMQAPSEPNAGVSYWLWCPACEDAHRITNGWSWNGNLERPTFQPSILVTGVQWGAEDSFYKAGHSSVARGGKTVCHSFLTDGVWDFLPDCTHDKAGLSVPMVPLPEWVAR